MSTLVFQMVTLVLAAFVAGCASGCVARRRLVPALASITLRKDAESLPPEQPETAGSGDDLTRIDGIGPATARRLSELGIQKFDQIAAWSEADIDRIGAELRLRRRIRREKWVEQARSLSRGAGRQQQ